MSLIGGSGFSPSAVGLTFSVQTDQNLKPGRRVSRFSSTVSRGLLEQTALINQPEYVYEGPNDNPAIRFDGEEQYLEFRGLASESLVHTFIFVVKPDIALMPGYLFSAEIGPAIKPRLLPGWQVYETTVEADGLNGDMCLGGKYNGVEGFFRGELAYFGYAPKELHPTVKEPFLHALKSKYGLLK